MPAQRMQELDLVAELMPDLDFLLLVRSDGNSPEAWTDHRVPAAALLDYGQIYDFGANLTEPPTALAVIGYACIGRDIAIPANFNDGVNIARAGKLPAGVNPDADFEIAIFAGSDQIGTVTISALGVATWATTGGIAALIDAGEIVSFVAPDQGTAQDLSIAGWSFNVNARTRLPVT
jgi:hypothetical protein